MAAIAPGETPHVGIFWLVQMSNGEARLLAGPGRTVRRLPHLRPGPLRNLGPLAPRPDRGSYPARNRAGLRIRRLAARAHRLRPGAWFRALVEATRGRACGRGRIRSRRWGPLDYRKQVRARPVRPDEWVGRDGAATCARARDRRRLRDPCPRRGRNRLGSAWRSSRDSRWGVPSCLGQARQLPEPCRACSPDRRRAP